ncbi:VCBS repeat-containing protein [Rhodothermus marinus]|uniref:ASPIC/UnbV domain protein n=1 Tax=Rhodothermus marinus (strain ATCC 43812 / DSM 4252 / R-10) TaxID=518766 RepID=D0MJI5_RHOM4|nr:VCBS repeat-containing protein [Rhodothermus marinus]ACY48643.1 ASPIC/UnbV domain protein [Rhodothermus marinus DSM 4252]
MRKLLLVLGLAGLSACRPAEPPLFERMDPDRTGITFVNEVPVDTAFNIINYMYYYDGAGVAAGDFNGDGWPDLYFVANRGPNRLFLNRSDWRFEDVTDAAGVAGSGNWNTGVAVADVDGNGWLDLYLVTFSNYLDRTGRNQLFLNQGPDETGIPRFREAAAEFGLDMAAYGTQAVFFDYDRDGDLDLYLLNRALHTDESFGPAEPLRHRFDPNASDRLLRNDDGRFVDVTAEAGIVDGLIGYGLGVVVSDLDQDGWPDLYVANDFHEDDRIYRNNGDGTFTDVLRTATAYISKASMGVDAGDVDNDGLPDLIVLDMMPFDPIVFKTADGPESFELFQRKRQFGYHPQYPHNVLLRNLGAWQFVDVAFRAGVAATDWSWAALLADLDNDGYQDLFVTNGIYHRPNDLDYIRYVGQPEIQEALARGITPELLEDLLRHMPQVPQPNFAFHNNGDGTFTNRTQAWGLGRPGFSTGAVYVDLDRDGDLDLVTSEINAPAAVYRNHTRERHRTHYLRVVLEGEGMNRWGIGARVTVHYGDSLQLRELQPVRGWLSSVEPVLHFGLGARTQVDSVTVVWPDGRYEVRRSVAADQTLTFRQAEAQVRYHPPALPRPLFQEVYEALPYRHEENAFVDFTREPLQPHRLSREGPALAVGDVNGDGLDDVFLGGAKWQSARLLVQQPDGTFRPTNEALWEAESRYEDVDAAFFDADGDGDLDLYVVSAGNEWWGQAEALRDRLYRNDGRGQFRRDEQALPDLFVNGCCVRVADYDGDGDPDLFVGGRVEARRYGEAPRSFLLENRGDGTFADVTEARAPALARVGMVTDAVWEDFNGDGRLDLLVVGEWMPLTLLSQDADGRLMPVALENTEGWWFSVQAADLDQDGDLDFVAGNLGLNASLQATPDRPVMLYLHDFDRDGQTDPVLVAYWDRQAYPVATIDLLVRRFPELGQQFESYRSWGARTLDELFGQEALRQATVRQAYTFASVWAENDGQGHFTLHSLPEPAQWFPVRALQISDVTGEGRPDIIAAGNFDEANPALGHYGHGPGAVLVQTKTGTFMPLRPDASGLILRGQVRHLSWLQRPDGQRWLLAARNDTSVQVLALRY